MDDVVKNYDFSVATDWMYDRDFVEILERACRECQLSSYVVWPENLEETYERLQRRDIRFQFLFDRASDSSPEFGKLYDFMLENHLPVLDAAEHLKRAADKATMHLDFIASGLLTPFTIIIPPYNKSENIYLSVSNLAKLGRPFIIKPANTTGGGIGVVNGAETLQDILQARESYKNDKYLLQEKIAPFEKETKRFWFRGFFCCGMVECCWWNDLTHNYDLLTPEEIVAHELEPLFPIIWKIAEVSRLNFFSTEIAVNHDRQFIIIDYVNEICDMRLKSRHPDGVPDEIVQKIAKRIVTHVKRKNPGTNSSTR